MIKQERESVFLHKINPTFLTLSFLNIQHVFVASKLPDLEISRQIWLIYPRIFYHVPYEYSTAFLFSFPLTFFSLCYHWIYGATALTTLAPIPAHLDFSGAPAVEIKSNLVWMAGGGAGEGKYVRGYAIIGSTKTQFDTKF